MTRAIVPASAFLAALTFVAPAGVAAAANAGDHHSAYSVSLIGLPVAQIKFRTSINGKDYRIAGDLKTSFLADILEPTRGTVVSDGKIVGAIWQPDAFEVRYKTGKKNYRAAMTLSGGNVKSTVIEPEKKRPGNWVAVSDADMRGVIDPLASLVTPAGTDPCNRTVPVFDGESRFDLKLSPKGQKPFSTSGFKGNTIVCAVKFIPKSGYRKGNSSIDYVRKQNMEIWFAQHPAGYQAPVYAKIPTKVGTLVVSATEYGK